MNAVRSLLTHRAARVVARWTLGIGLVAALVIGLDTAEIGKRIASANLALVVVGVAGLVAVHTLGAAAWRTLCRRLGGLTLPWSASLRIYYAAQALGGITPANLGGDAYRVVAVRSAGHEWGAAVAPVVVQRATSYLALALLALPALLWLAATSHVPAAVLVGGLLLCGMAGGVAIVLLVAPSWLAKVGRRLGMGGTDATGDEPAGFASATRPPLAGVAVATALGAAFHGVSVLLTVLLLVAVDPAAMNVAVLAAVVVARLSLAIPFLPSGLGANEAILSLLVAGLGMTPQTALAGLLLGRVSLVCTTLLGAGLLALGRRAVATGAQSVTVLDGATARQT